MELILEGVLQSSIIVSLCTCILTLLLKRWLTSWKPTVILGIWCMLSIRLLICYPILYFNALIKTVANYFMPPFETSIKTSNSLVSISFSHLNIFPIFIIWIIGVAIFLLINIIHFNIIMKKIMAESKYVSNLYEFSIKYGLQELKCLKNISVRYCSSINNPMISGFFKKVLFMPQRNLEDEDIKLMIIHETLHYRYNDLFIKHLLLIANAIHWFNPLVYLMQRHLTEAIELACDYRAVRNMPKENREEYMELLCYSTVKSRRIQSILFMSSNSKLLMHRLENIATVDKKKNLWLCIVFIIAILLALQPFVYVDIFSKPFESSYLYIQYENKEGITQSKVLPFANLYYSQNNGNIRSIGDEESITLMPSDNIILYYNYQKKPLFFDNNEYLFIKLKTIGNKELSVEINEHNQVINKRMERASFFFKEKTTSTILITNHTSDIIVLY